MLRTWHRKNIYHYLGYSIIVMDSSSKFFFSFSVNYVMIIKLVDLIVLLGSKSLNRFRKFSTDSTCKSSYNPLKLILLHDQRQI